MQGDDVDREAEHRQMCDGIGLGQIVYPEKPRVSQLDSLREHLVKPEENRDLNGHWQTTAYGINAVLLVKLHHLLVHPCRVVFIFFAQLLHFRSKQRCLTHCLIRFTLERPEHQAHDEGQYENGDAVIFYETVNGVEKIEKKLADDFEYAEVHDLGFVVLELSQPMIDFRARPDLEARSVSLSWLYLKSGHAHCPFDAGHVLRGRDFKRTAPNTGSFRA